MTHTKTNVVVVVAPAASSIPVPAGRQVVHVDDISRLFPVIHQLQPGAIILNHDYLGEKTEKVLRRMAFNPFYSKIKICCYKTKAHSKVDALLKALGVQQFIYAHNMAQQPKYNRTIKALGYILKTGLTGKLVDADF